MEATYKLNYDLSIKNILKETNKAVLVNVKRYLNTVLFDKDGNKKRGYKLFNDQMWIPKSQIINGKVSSWFSEKEEISEVL